MTNSMETDSEDRHRAESPALSDTPVLTTLSRPPSPILRYDAYASPEKFQDSPRPSDRPTTNGTIAQHTIALLGTDGGFGTLDRLPIELGQEIYGLAFGIDLPVTVKDCCVPGTTKRMLELCPKHGAKTKTGAARFNILRVSKAMRTEAMWVVFGQTSLLLNTQDSMSKYYTTLFQRRTLRKVMGYRKPTPCKSLIWQTANQFRNVKIEISDDELQWGNPYIFIDRLVCMVTLLCKEQDKDETPSRSVHLDLGSFFHQMLPFNEKSQLYPRYGEYLDWLCVHSDIAAPDHDKLAKGIVRSLQRLITTIANHSGRAQWKIFVKIDIPEEDEGGVKALSDFQIACAEQDVECCRTES